MGATPSEIVLTFDQPAVAMGTRVVVTGPSGPVQTGTARLVDDTVTQAVAGGAPAGAYTVAWRVTSADGHPVSGTFTFTSTSAGAGSPPVAAAPAPAEPAAGEGGAPAGAAVGVAARCWERPPSRSCWCVDAGRPGRPVGDARRRMSRRDAG